MYRAVLLALLLLLSVPGAVASPPPQDSITPAQETNVQNNSSTLGVLTLEEPSTGTFVTASLDVGAAITIQQDAVESRVDRYALDERVEAAPNETIRRELLLDALIRSKARADDFRERERSLRGAFRNGTIDASTYTRRLARLNARAGNLRLYLDRIDSYASQIPEFTLQRRLQRVDGQLVGLDGRLRDRALASIRGTAPPSRLYVEVARDGVVLSLIVGDSYVREAYRPDQRSEAPVGINLDRVVDRVEEIYPAAFAQSVPTGIRGIAIGIYRITFDFPSGSVVAYLDGGTRDVFYEVHNRRLQTLAGSETASASANGTRIVVNRSYPGGPLRVATFDNATGGAVNATVIVNDAEFQTGTDGVLWTLTPKAGRFTVTAVRPQGTVTVFVRPISSPPLEPPR